MSQPQKECQFEAFPGWAVTKPYTRVLTDHSSHSIVGIAQPFTDNGLIIEGSWKLRGFPVRVNNCVHSTNALPLVYNESINQSTGQYNLLDQCAQLTANHNNYWITVFPLRYHSHNTVSQHNQQIQSGGCLLSRSTTELVTEQAGNSATLSVEWLYIKYTSRQLVDIIGIWIKSIVVMSTAYYWPVPAASLSHWQCLVNKWRTHSL